MNTMISPRFRPALWSLCVFVFSLFLTITSAFSASVIYIYDARHRVIEATYDDGKTIQYIYDVTGNIITRKNILPVDLDSDGDGITDIDEINIYGTDPNNADSDVDGINDGAELNYWGTNWNADPDNDGIINLLDSDSDNDGFLDGDEINQGTNPADPYSLPTREGTLPAILYLLLRSS